jgi:uncharacterized protein YaaR (DUF327 family)
MMDLFEDDFKRVKLFEDSVLRFKKASRNLQFLYNLQRSKVKYHGYSFHEELEPILSLIEGFKGAAKDLYHLRKISPLRPLKKAIERFTESFIESSLSDDDIRDIYRGHELIRGVLISIYNDLDRSISLFEESKMRGDDFLGKLKALRSKIKDDYAVFA